MWLGLGVEQSWKCVDGNVLWKWCVLWLGLGVEQSLCLKLLFEASFFFSFCVHEKEKVIILTKGEKARQIGNSLCADTFAVVGMGRIAAWSLPSKPTAA